MTDMDPSTDGIIENEPRVSRRELLGVTTIAAAGLGGLGLAASSRRARAQVQLNFDDESVTLSPDDDVSGVTVSGTVEASYRTGDSNADSAALNVTVADTAGTGIAGGNASFNYEDVAPDSGEVTENVEISFSVPPEVADPEEGSTIETEFFVDVLFFVDDAENQLIIEAIGNDTATLRVEREAGTDGSHNEETDDGNAANDEAGTEPASADVGGAFEFDVEVE